MVLVEQESLISPSLRSLAWSERVWRYTGDATQGARWSRNSQFLCSIWWEIFWKVTKERQSTRQCHWYGEKYSWKMQLQFTLGALWVKLKSKGPFLLLEDLLGSSWSSPSWECRQSRRPISKDGDFSWRGQSCRQRSVLLVGRPSLLVFRLV